MPYLDAEKQKQYQRDRMRRKREANRAVINMAKADGCRACPEKTVACLAFHHTNPSTKDFTIGQYMGRSLGYLLDEVDKCVVLCHNCHAKVHAGIISIPTGATG